jgi:hypothetical protein
MSLTTFSVFEHLAGALAETEQERIYPLLPGAARREGAPERATSHAQPSSEQPKPPPATGTGTSYMASKANLKSSGREAALARRKAMSTQGKQGLRTSAPERTRTVPQQAPAARVSAPASAQTPTPTPAAAPSPWGSAAPAPRARRASAFQSPSQASRALARQRRAALAQDGRRAQRSRDRVRTPHDGDKAGAASSPPTPVTRRAAIAAAAVRASGKDSQRPATDLGQFAHQPGAPVKTGSATASRARSPPSAPMPRSAPSRPRACARSPGAALSSRGKGADTNAQSAASLARQANPKLSGRELAQKVRAQRSSNGGAGERKSAPTGRIRPNATKGPAGATISPGRSASARPPWASSSPAPRSAAASRPPATSRAPAAPSPAPNTWARTSSASSARPSRP